MEKFGQKPAFFWSNIGVMFYVIVANDKITVQNAV